MADFDLQLFGSSNNAAQQNQAAQQQIGQNTQQAIAAIQAWLGGHPFPVSGANSPSAPPQFGGVLGGGTFGGAQGGPMAGGKPGLNTPPLIPPQPGGSPQMRIPNPGVGAPPQPQGPQPPGMGMGGEGGGNRHIIEILKSRGLI